MTNNCTLFPEGAWTTCCARHDRRYTSKRLTRLQADILLYRCVKRKGYPVIAILMFLGVRIVGKYYYAKAIK